MRKRQPVTSNRKGPSPWSPTSFRDEKFSPVDLFVRSIVLLAANKLGVFRLLSNGPLALEEIVALLHTDPKGTRIMLDALVVLEYLVKNDGLYENEADTARYLTERSPEFIGNRFLHSYEGIARWLSLEKLVRKGQKYKQKLPEFRTTEAQERRREKSFAVGLSQSSRETANKITGILNLDGVVDFLDLGGGAGSYSIALARTYPDLKPTVFELPAPAQVAREQVKEVGLQDRIRVRSGDFLRDDLGKEAYDAVFLSNIIHIFSCRKNRELFRKIHRALRPKGRIFVKDMFVNEERDGPYYPVVFALTMLLFTDEGDTYTFSDVTAWLREAGFTRITRRTVIPHESFLLIGKER